MEFFDETETFGSQPVNFSGNRSDCRLSYFRKYGEIPGNVPSAAVTAGMGIPDNLVNSVYIDGDCSIQNLYEESKSGKLETLSDPAGSKLPLADNFL